VNNKSKKILFIGKRSFHSLGNYDYEYLKRLSQSQVNASIFFACSSLYDQKLIDGIKYMKLFNYNNLSQIKKFFSYLNSLLKILKFIKKNKPDAIHLQWLLFPLIDLIWLKTIKFIGWEGLVIITIHNAKSRKSRITNFFLNCCYKEINHFVVHSSKCKEYLISKYKFLKSNSIYEGRHGLINLKTNESLKKDELKIFSLICKLRKKYKNIYIYIGNLSIYKGFDLLLQSWNIYKEKSQDNNNSALIILGKADKSIRKFLLKNKIYDDSIIYYNSFVSDQIINLSVDQSDFILLLHRYISHSGIHSSLLSKYKTFIYNNNKNNHMLSHEYFKKTGIPFNNSISSLSNLFYMIEKKKIKINLNSKDWANAMKYFSWENSFPDHLLNKIYK